MELSPCAGGCVSGEVSGSGPGSLEEWRRRFFFLGMALLALLIASNIFLTLFILKGIHFSLAGMGNVEIQEDGLKVRGRVDVYGTVYSNQIKSAKETLHLKSFHNLSLNSRNIQGKVTARMELGASGVDVLADSFTVRAPSGRLLFYRDQHDVLFGVDTLKISGQRRISVRGSIQTPVVRAEQFQAVKMESVTRSIQVRGPEKIQLGARTGTVQANCNKEINLKSLRGIISLSSPQIQWKNLRMALPSTRGKIYPGIFQLCSCNNGRLFMDPANGLCHGDQTVCK